MMQLPGFLFAGERSVWRQNTEQCLRTQVSEIVQMSVRSRELFRKCGLVQRVFLHAMLYDAAPYFHSVNLSEDDYLLVPGRQSVAKRT